MKHTINAFIAGLWLLISAGAGAAPAMPLSQIEILKVASGSGAVEDVSDGREQTKMQHRGPHIKVYVLERGYGRQPTVTFDGQTINGARTPVCNKGEGLVTCDGAGTTVGYVYTFDLGNNAQGWFQFSNTSLVAPFTRLGAQLHIN
ncbi:YolA family protein [Pseudomonas sp. 7P_10.2_Bac1]|uniref:YolA family protein n=1 Tax=Pseudomonas sp. 7P_10.2_Bac1 TaxID=2971614 RepID=UPI0021C8635D|nr:YolA family protein [Pseudomonas sp. 7P_10.2_Bac1]MCU1727690.1 YolA family protein [Pseudomonas sp. 7P_10.2_Bac1]